MHEFFSSKRGHRGHRDKIEKIEGKRSVRDWNDLSVDRNNEDSVDGPKN